MIDDPDHQRWHDAATDEALTGSLSRSYSLCTRIITGIQESQLELREQLSFFDAVHAGKRNGESLRSAYKRLRQTASLEFNKKDIQEKIQQLRNRNEDLEALRSQSDQLRQLDQSVELSQALPSAITEIREINREAHTALSSTFPCKETDHAQHWAVICVDDEVVGCKRLDLTLSYFMSGGKNIECQKDVTLCLRSYKHLAPGKNKRVSVVTTATISKRPRFADEPELGADHSDQDQFGQETPALDLSSIAINKLLCLHIYIAYYQVALLRKMAAKTTYYSVDNVIQEFFHSESTTRKQCDDLAASLLGDSVLPVPIQGCFSYTVAGSSAERIVQFRRETAALDMELIRLSRIIYGPFVAECTYHGTIDAESKTVATVTDFGRFFAASWKHPQTLDSSKLLHLRKEYQKRVDLLVEGLPPRFAPQLKIVQQQLSSLFTSQYPLILSHQDLCEMNILTDSKTGHVTGVIDWESSQILPFGISLWGLENCLGWMDSRGWHYYPNRDALVRTFWESFYQELAVCRKDSEESIPKLVRQPDITEDILGSTSNRVEKTEASGESQEYVGCVRTLVGIDTIMVARSLGILCRYGFAWNRGDWEIATAEDGDRLKYLDAFLSTTL
ncbi:hypothetical protein O1611_g1676 [Lasiodiplodia mahajangana]|uniref:Uncharacterized protein n=1 Tax=Lasiodiplodia mahajangana TaxID=1108764 RepID=A0ACC2JWP5_9PEZI|nr:hypothetical protein O1611_g1676 [Lasiodiplodia mahajangana]